MASTSPGCKEATTDRWNGKEYSTKALAAQWRPRPEKAFRAYESTRARSAVYDYLTPVYEFAIGFDGWPDADKVGLAMLASTELGLRTRKNRFSSVLRATATIDEKTRWKWVRCLKLAFSEEIEPDKLQSFILDEHGGINGCAAAWVSNVGN